MDGADLYLDLEQLHQALKIFTFGVQTLIDRLDLILGVLIAGDLQDLPLQEKLWMENGTT